MNEDLGIGDQNFWICDGSVDEVYRGKDYPEVVIIRDCENGVKISIWTEYGKEQTMNSARNLLRLLNE